MEDVHSKEENRNSGSLWSEPNGRLEEKSKDQFQIIPGTQSVCLMD